MCRTGLQQGEGVNGAGESEDEAGQPTGEDFRKKKSKKLKKGEPEQSAFEAVTASEKRRSRRYYSIQIGESSATKEKDPPTTKPVSASTIAMPVVTQVGKGGTIKLKNRNAWDALGDELALEIFLHLDTRSLGTVCRDCRVCAMCTSGRRKCVCR